MKQEDAARASLLSEEWVEKEKMAGVNKTQMYPGLPLDTWKGGFMYAMNLMQDRIASGELRVVKKVGVELVPNNYDCHLTCTGCGDGTPYYLLEEFDDMNYCPSCGSEIIKP